MQRARQRHIIHCDMDAFYAAVEQRDAPELRGRPVIVGGDPLRGVVSACSYEARGYGVHSAMPMARALKLCPVAVVRKVRMQRYREASRAVFAIFSRYTDRVEPLSIDEAFLDVTGCERLLGPAPAIAAEIRQAVRRELALPVSAGVAPNKFLAKLASQAAKPDGLLVVREAEIEAFLTPLPVEALWGVGRVTAERLRTAGVRTVGELRAMDRSWLVRRFGQAGDKLHRLARGLDERPVRAADGPKSVSHEDTFARDVVERSELERILRDQAERVARRLRAGGLRGRRLTLKVRYGDFTTVTRSRTLERAIDSGLFIWQEARLLLAETEAGRRPVRLLGVGVTQWEADGEHQGALFADPGGDERRRSLDRAVDALQRRFGVDGIRPADLAAGSSGGEEGPDGGE